MAGPALFWMTLLIRTGCAEHVDDRRAVREVAGPVGISVVAGSAGVVLQRRVGDADAGLVYFDGVEGREAAGDRGGAAGIFDHGIVDAAERDGIEHQSAPVPRRGRRRAGVARRHEAAAGAVAVVVQRSEDDRVLGGSFGDQRAVTDLGFDACSVQLDDHARRDQQSPRGGAAPTPESVVRHGAAGAAVDFQIFAEDVGDIRVDQAGGDREDVEARPGGRGGCAGLLGGDPDEHAVDLIVLDRAVDDDAQRVGMDQRADPPIILRERGYRSYGLELVELRVLESVRVPRHGRIRAVDDRVVGDRRAASRSSGWGHRPRGCELTSTWPPP